MIFWGDCLFPRYIFKNYIAINVWVYVYIFYSILLTYVSVLGRCFVFDVLMMFHYRVKNVYYTLLMFTTSLDDLVSMILMSPPQVKFLPLCHNSHTINKQHPLCSNFCFFEDYFVSNHPRQCL